MFKLGPSADPFFEERGFISSPWPVHTLLAIYLLFVLKLGKIFMKNRKPYNVKNTILVYNMIQVIYNLILFGFAIYWLVLYPIHDFRCMPKLPLDHPLKNIERWLCYFGFLNKVLDLMDTVFFVLRKSYRQITFLHVYHHVLMVFGPYWGMWYYGYGGQIEILGILNTFVHTWMYSYYFLTTLNPKMKTKLWLKKGITLMVSFSFAGYNPFIYSYSILRAKSLFRFNICNFSKLL